MLRAQKLALAFEGDDASGWTASILQATAEPGVTGVVRQRRDASRRGRGCLAAPYRIESGKPGQSISMRTVLVGAAR